MAVWTEERGGDIYYCIYRNGQWSDVMNAGVVKQSAACNQLAVDSSGMFHISFCDGFGSGSRDVYYSYYTGNGWAPPEMIYYSPYNSAWNKIDVDASNDIHITWGHDYVLGSSSSDIVMMSKQRMGDWPSSYENISRTPSGGSWHPAFAAKGGNIYASWVEGGARSLYYCAKTGGGWRTPVRVYSPGYYPEMAVDDSGNVHIVFSNRGGNLYYISRINGKWTEAQVLSDGVAPLQFGDIYYKNNLLVAAWAQLRNDRVAIHATAKIPGGQWMPVRKIADLGEWRDPFIQVVLDTLGNAHFVWSMEGVGGNEDIFYEKVAISDPGGTYMEVDNSFLNFVADASGNPDPQTFRLRSRGEDPVNYTISSDYSWLTVNPLEGTSSGEWDTVTVEANPSNLSYGTHYGTITITSPDAYNSPVQVSVSLTITGPTIEVDKSSLDFIAELFINPGFQTFKIKNSGKSTLNYTISSEKSWLTVNPQEGISTGEWDTIKVKVDVSTLSAGTHSGTLTIVSPDATNSPVLIGVNLSIEGPAIEVNKDSLDFSTVISVNPRHQTFRVKNSGKSTLDYTVSSEKSWLTVNPQEGTSTGEWNTIIVKVDSLDLSAGSRRGIITITAPYASNNPQKIKVSLTIIGPAIAVNKQSLDFETEELKNPSPQTFLVKNSNAATMDYTVTANKKWLNVFPQQGQSLGEWDKIKVNLDVSNLSVGNYLGTIIITAPKASNSPVRIGVSLIVTKRKSPYIQLDRTALSFSAFAAGDNPFSQIFKIKNYGTTVLHYEVIANKDWIKISPARGTSTEEWDTIAVSVDISGFLVGLQNGVIKITSSNADNSPQRIEVGLDILLPQQPYSPLNVQVERIDHEGLIIKDYKNMITWQKNSKNTGLFDIVKYRIYRKDISDPNSAYVFIDEVASDIFAYYDSGFSTKTERNKYSYAVTCVDSAGRESLKAEA